MDQEERLKIIKQTNPSAIISTWIDNHLIGMAAKEAAMDALFPLETATLASLVASSHAVGSVYSVLYPDGSELPIPLYAIAEQPSGTSKSRVMRDMYSGYIEKGAELNAQIAKERESLRKEIAIENKQNDKGAHPNKIESLECLVDIPSGTTDATPQSLEKVMDRLQGFFMVYGTEQNLTKTLLGGLYSDGDKVDGIINSAFNGEYSSSERASIDRVTFRGQPFGGIFCLSQEGTIQTVLDSAGSSGLAERFLMIREDDLLGKRDKYPNISSQDLQKALIGTGKVPPALVKGSKQVMKKPAFKQYYQKMASLAVERSQLKHGCKLKDLKPIRFSQNGWAIIEAAKTIMERDTAAQKTRNAFLASMNSKIDILIMKAAATIHVMDTEAYQEIGEISEDTTRHAFQVVFALIEGVAKISGENNLFGDKAEDEAIYDYLQSAKGPQNLTKIGKSVLRKKYSPFRFYQKRGEGMEKVRESMARLIDNGRVYEKKGQTPTYGVWS